MRLDRVLCLDDFEALARRRLPRPLFGYIASATETRQSFTQNRAAFAEFDFLPYTMRDVSRHDTSTTLFGHTYAAPFGITPMGLVALSTFEGDKVFARCATHANIPMVLSGASLTPLEAIAEIAPHAWFQAYLPNDLEQADALLDRVAAAGYETLVITVDLAVDPNPENQIRSGFTMPFRITPRLVWDVATRPHWLVNTWLKTWRKHGVPRFANARAHQGKSILDPAAASDFGDGSNPDWERFAHIRRRWKGNLVLKGLLNPADARRAREEGADGIVVSNHGGRQLDGAIAPIRILPEMVEAAGPMTVIIDSGFRRGADVIKALALGADFVFVGRPFNFAAAIARDAGVMHAIHLLQSEIARDLGFLGLSDLSEIAPELIRRR